MPDWKLGRTYRSGSGEVRWDVLGEPHADPVVLLHGTPFSSYVWRGIARALATTHRVYVWDMPGYGTSEMSDGQDVSLAAQGDVFTELLAHWGCRSRPSLRMTSVGPSPFERIFCTALATVRSPWSTLWP